jgi:phosphoenolpyruvate---glycerone phosphotransferase subunit DhaM
VISTRMAIDELLPDELRGRVRISEGPVVEGAVIGAVQASTGSSLEEVATAAARAATLPKVKD